MSSGTKISIMDSIATRMLLAVLGLYLLIAIGVTLSTIWMEYSYQKSNIIQDLGDIENAFEQGLAVSLWGLDEKALNASVKGMLMIPTLVGVKITTERGTTVALGGIVTTHGKTGKAGLHVNLSGIDENETTVQELVNLEMFERQFPIIYDFGGENILLGRVTIYSNSSVIYRRMKLQGAMLVVNIFVTLFTFCLALLWAVNRYLRRPLASLASDAEKVSLDNLDSFRMRIGISGQNELTVVEDAFNLMISNLHQSVIERALAEKETKNFQSAVAASTDAIGMATPDGKHYYQNKAFDRMFGNISDDPSTVYVDQDASHEVFQAVMAGQQWIGEVRMYGIDNKIRDIFLRAYAVLGDDGKAVNLIGVHTDITARKQAEKNLADEKERLAVTLRSIGDGVITTDIAGHVILLNRVAEELTGWHQEEAAGHPLEEIFCIINEQTREICENPATKVIHSGQIIGLANHTVLIARDGTERSIADSGAPILDDESNIIGVVLVFRDVTELNKTEKELLKIKKLESVGVLAGGIAHDFNNILAAVLGNINLALFDENLQEETRQLLSEVEKASIRAKDLTQQLLTLAKGGDPVKEIASLDSIIQDSANFVLHGDKVACRFEIADNLRLVDIDKGQISQVIQNIVLNASHAMPEGGTITVTCENVSSDECPAPLALQKDLYVKICVKDTGIGMAENVVEKIFDPYFSTKQEGSGLGLAITHSIISKHGGHIAAKSSPGVGTTFTLYLPASKHQKPNNIQAGEHLKTLSKAKIMIMDDEEMVRSVAQRMLMKLGHDVMLASDGKKALELYQQSLDSGKPFDLVIMDLTIPGGMGGEEAVKKILSIDPGAQVIVSSGYSNDPIMANYQDFGFCAAIVKPYQLQDLARIISQVID